MFKWFFIFLSLFSLLSTVCLAVATGYSTTRVFAAHLGTGALHDDYQENIYISTVVCYSSLWSQEKLMLICFSLSSGHVYGNYVRLVCDLVASSL